MYFLSSWSCVCFKVNKCNQILFCFVWKVSKSYFMIALLDVSFFNSSSIILCTLILLFNFDFMILVITLKYLLLKKMLAFYLQYPIFIKVNESRSKLKFLLHSIAKPNLVNERILEKHRNIYTTRRNLFNKF